MHLPLLQQRSQPAHMLLLAFFLHLELFGPVSSSPAKIADGAAIFLSASRITSLGRLLGVASGLGLFASSALLPCFGRSLCADLVFVFFSFWFPPCTACLSAALFGQFWRFTSSPLHSLACEQDSCNPQALYFVCSFQSVLWTQLQGDKHCSSVS